MTLSVGRGLAAVTGDVEGEGGAGRRQAQRAMATDTTSQRRPDPRASRAALTFVCRLIEIP